MKLDCNNVIKHYGKVKAVDGVTCSFSSGHIVGLFGRNGAGKSTLIKTIGNRIFQDEGIITLDGEKLTSSSKLFKNIFISSEDNMFPSMSIKNILTLMDDMEAGSKEKALQLCKEFHLNENKKWDKLSTGYRTIFKDILALSSYAKFVFFDEPILGLDANHRELFYEKLLASFSPDRCFIIATHLIDEIEPLVDEVIIINNGKVIESGDKEKMLENLFLVSGTEEDVEKALKECKVISSTIRLGKRVVLVKGKIESSDRLSITPVDLQKYFIELTKDNDYEN